MGGTTITKRFSLIVYLLDRGGYPPMNDIMEFLQQRDIERTKRTLQRDFVKIRDELGIVIKYDASKRGYYIDREESLPNNAFEDLIELSNLNDLIIENMKGFGMQPDYLGIESRTDLDGMENFRSLLLAIQNRKVITFNYFKYTSGEHGFYTVRPYFLKEFERRWYLIGIRDDINQRRIFGIDRITNLQTELETFVRDERVMNTQYNDMIGVNIMGENIEKITLEFDVILGRYAKSLPWHSSQKVVEESDDKIKLELTVYPSYELFNRIMKFGSQVKVLEPAWLAEMIMEEYEKGISNYN